ELEGLSCDNHSALEFNTLEVTPRLLGGKAWNVRGHTPKMGFCAKTKIQYNRRFGNVVPKLSKEGPNANS
uniref:40S ribosomal protein S30 n=1 Tax=Hucho hucho TaxID=62062 RepID=A0A4W5R684_9TELE